MKYFLISIVVVSLLLADQGGSLVSSVEKITQTNSVTTQSLQSTEIAQPELQGHSPFAIAITNNGEYAYLGFDLAEVVFKVRLKDMFKVGVADLSEYFPMESELMALDHSENKLFIYVQTRKKFLVLDTQSMQVIHTIENIQAWDLIRSQYGPYLMALDGGGLVNIINTDTYEVTEFEDQDIATGRIQESNYNENQWYVVTREATGFKVGIYNKSTKVWSNAVSIPFQVQDEGLMALRVLPNEQKAYLATFGGWYPDYHAYGWLYSIDLIYGGTTVIPIDGGAFCLEASADSQRLFVGTGWPIPNDNNILVLDTITDKIMGKINLKREEYRNPHTQINDLQIGSANPNLLYATAADSNSFLKIDLTTLTQVDKLFVNNQSFGPHYFIAHPSRSSGYVLIHQSKNAFELDLQENVINGIVEFPLIRDDIFAYDGVFNDAGELLIAQGESILEIDTEGMRLLKTHLLPQNLAPVWQFVLSNDWSRMYSISQERNQNEYHPDIFQAINTVDYGMGASFQLDGGSFKERPFVLPDGKKLYAVGGLTNSPVTIQVIDANSLTVTKTISFDEPDLLGIADGTYYPYAYDPASHILFVGATYVVLAINTETDTIVSVIKLGDAAWAIGLEPWELTYINAIGLVYNPHENYLYIAHLDRSFVSIYDLNEGEFLPKAISLKGFFPVSIFANSNFSKIYSLNAVSDNISVIDVSTKTIEKIIDLHAYIPGSHKVYLPSILK